MKLIRHAAPIAALATLLAGACSTNGAAGTSSGLRTAQSGTMVQITPEIRAEVRRQGHDPDEEVCKRVEQMGSTIPRNVCSTRAAWEAKAQASKDGTADMQRNGLRTTAPGSGG